MKNYDIAVIGGDGTGPEVISVGKRVLKSVAKKHDFSIKFKEYDFGGERYLRTGKTLDDSDVNELKQFKAIYLGAIGHPEVEPGILETEILLRLRFDLQQYVNLRPVKLYPGVDCPLKDKGPEDIDFVVVRENNWGLYGGVGGVMFKDTDDEIATQGMVYNAKSVDQCLRFAFEYARKERKLRPWKGLSKEDLDKGFVGQLTLVGKTNVLTYVYGLWGRRFHKMGKEKFPDIKRDYAHVDATCMWMIKNPEWFDVIVTGNMFGDIITDEGAMIQGGMGIAAGANINPEGTSMFEPIGGSTPKYTGKNVINPLAAIEAGRMMMDYLGEKEAAKSIEDAVSSFLEKKIIDGLSVKDIENSGLGTSGIGKWIMDHIGGR